MQVESNAAGTVRSGRGADAQAERGTRENETGRLTDSTKSTRFALVIPALNEEDVIGSTLERALAARRQVVASTPIDEMIVVFVNDGSTDRTEEIADRYSEVRRIRFEKNRGYGAAIKAGFAATDADVVGFMDADGTCDPPFCAQLINRLYEAEADIVLGSRLNAESKMPVVRQIGNRIFARLIGIMSGGKLTDCASGMRVLRRSSLYLLEPLPDGLHFTPVMSCVAMFDPQLRLEEVPMTYEERIGRSKLSAVKDGVKFLSTIVFAACCYNPIKILTVLGFLFCILGACVSYVSSQYGVSALMVAGLMGAFLFVFIQAVCIGLLCHELNHTLIGRRGIPGTAERALERVLEAKPMVTIGIVLFLFGVTLFVYGLVAAPQQQSFIVSGAALCVAFGGWAALGGIILRVIWAVNRKAEAAREHTQGRTSEAMGD